MALSVNGGFGSKGGGSNPNLLDNGWFTVNQRGLTEYVPSSDYGVDRWRRWSSSNTITIASDGLHFTSTTNNQVFAQLLENPTSYANKTVTISAKVNSSGSLKLYLYDGSTEYISPAYDVNAGDVVSYTITPTNGIVRAGVITNGVPFTLRAVKLEYGTVSTLALDSAPNYTTELLKCQRYFYRYKATNDAQIGYGVMSTSVLSRIQLIVPVPMRTTPTVTYNFGSNNFRVRTSANHLAIVSAIRIMAYSGGNDVYVYVDHDSLTDVAGTLAMLNVNSSNGYIDLSADL